MALDAILSAVPREMHRTLAVKRTSKEAWEAIKAIHIGTGRAQKMTLQRLRRDWELLSFRDGERVDDFALRLTGMMSSLNLYGEQINEQRAVEKLLRVVPEQYKQVAIAIDTLLDTADLSIEEVTGRLKAIDEEEGAPPSSSDQPLLSSGKLYFTEEQWLAGMKQRQAGEGGSKAPKSGNGGRRRGRGTRKKQERVPAAMGEAKDVGHGELWDKCHNCGRYGHWAKDCRKPKRAQANLTQVDEDDDEPTLLMAQACELSSAPT